MSGERTPHNNPHAQGCFFGLTNDHDAAALGSAVVEGVTFGLLDGWHSLGVQPGEVASLSLVGGGARSGRAPCWSFVPPVDHTGVVDPNRKRWKRKLQHFQEPPKLRT